MLKKIIQALLSALGYEIHAKAHAGFNAEHLAALCAPRTVFDVGVGAGTPELYKAFPRARFILVEPAAEFSGTLDALSARLDCRIYRKAAGSAPGTAMLTVEKEPQLSSLEDRPRNDKPETARQVEVITLDGILLENPGLEKPILVKIDTEGHELEVLKGARRLLAQTDFVIAEVSVADRFKRGYSFEDLVALMRTEGFAVFDLLTVSRSGTGGANMTDILFRKIKP